MNSKLWVIYKMRIIKYIFGYVVKFLKLSNSEASLISNLMYVNIKYFNKSWIVKHTENNIILKSSFYQKPLFSMIRSQVKQLIYAIKENDISKIKQILKLSRQEIVQCFSFVKDNNFLQKLPEYSVLLKLHNSKSETSTQKVEIKKEETKVEKVKEEVQAVQTIQEDEELDKIPQDNSHSTSIKLEELETQDVEDKSTTVSMSKALDHLQDLAIASRVAEKMYQVQKENEQLKQKIANISSKHIKRLTNDEKQEILQYLTNISNSLQALQIELVTKSSLTKPYIISIDTILDTLNLMFTMFFNLLNELLIMIMSSSDINPQTIVRFSTLLSNMQTFASILSRITNTTYTVANEEYV